MGTPARKVSLIDIADYPKSRYSAHWHIVVSGGPAEGYQWRATISANGGEPVEWEWKGKVTKTRPEAPQPEYPPAPNVLQAQYEKMTPAEQAAVRARQDAWRAECAKVYDAHPKPRYVLEETVGAVVVDDLPASSVQALESGDLNKKEKVEALDRLLRDAADTAAQTWVKERMKAYAIKAKPESGHTMVLGPAGMLWDVAMEALKRLFSPLILMALSYSTTIRDNRLTQVVNAIDGGAGAGLLRIYDGSRPATCGTATTLLAEITLSDPCATVSGQVLTFDNTPALTDSSANATGTATWHRFVDSTGTCCVDGNCGTSGSDLNFNSVSISLGQTVTVSSYTITAGNA